jgi:hypothetical protein
MTSSSSSSSPTFSLPENDLERLARRRASAKLRWYAHACIYVLVNLLLVMMSALGGRGWAVFPLLGWGIGLAAHGSAVFLFGSGTALHERLVQRERARLVLQRDPW